MTEQRLSADEIRRQLGYKIRAVKKEDKWFAKPREVPTDAKRPGNFAAIEKFDKFFSSVREITALKVERHGRKVRTHTRPFQNTGHTPTGSLYKGANNASALHLLVMLSQKEEK